MVEFLDMSQVLICFIFLKIELGFSLHYVLLAISSVRVGCEEYLFSFNASSASEKP